MKNWKSLQSSMKKYKLVQIPFKNYASQFKDCKLVHSNQEMQISFVRSVSSRKKHLVLRKFNCQQSLVLQILATLRTFQLINSLPFVNKFIGYALEHFTHPQRSLKMANVYLLFEFGESSLDSFVQTPSDRSRGESLNLLHLICNRLLEISMSLSLNNLDLKYLCFDLKLIGLELHKENVHKVNFSYLPFDFLYSQAPEPNQFTTQIYSLKDLQALNLRQQSHEIESIFEKNINLELWSSRDMRNRCSEGEMLQKIGIFLIKQLLLTCQQIHFRQVEIDLYAINKDFQIDYNWGLINPLLVQCCKEKDYRKIAKIIEFMLLNQNQDGFEYYRRKIEEIYEAKPSYSLPSQHKYEQSSNSKSKTNRDSIARSQSSHKHSKIFKQTSSKSISKRKQMTREDILQKKELIERRIQELPNVVQIYHQNGKYVGQTKEDKREGIGIYYFREGEIYGGEWKNDEMMGQGSYLFLAQKQYYEGDVDCGTRSGFGCYHYKDGKFYSGEWQQDLKEGYGELYIPQADEVYKGSFKNNLQDGLGTIQYPNGSKFEGSFSQGLKNGLGYIYNNNSELTLQANWIQDQITGQAQIFYENGDHYKGEIKDGMMHGEGEYRYKCGTTYFGQFFNNQMTGSCKISYSNGDSFQGTTECGKFTSRGSYYYKASNLVETCSWIAGQEQGEAQFLHENKQFVGVMKNHKLHSTLVQTQQYLQDTY